METKTADNKPAATEPKQAPDAAKPAKSAGKKKGGCLKGCLIFFVFLLLLVGGIAAVAYRLPQRLGLVKSPAEKLYSGTPFRAEAAAIKEELRVAGVATDGIDIQVFPVTGTDQVVALATLDASQGFHFSASDDGEPVSDTFIRMINSQAAKDLGVSRVAVAYKDAKGRPLMAVTASTEAINDFAEKRITKEQFYQRMNGRLDIPNLTAAFQEEIDAMNAKAK